MAKFTSVGFLPPIAISEVSQTDGLMPFKKRKKSNLNRLCAWNFIKSFPAFLITKVVGITNDFTGNMRMMNDSLVFYDGNHIDKNFSDMGKSPFTLSVGKKLIE